MGVDIGRDHEVAAKIAAEVYRPIQSANFEQPARPERPARLICHRPCRSSPASRGPHVRMRSRAKPLFRRFVLQHRACA